MRRSKEHADPAGYSVLVCHGDAGLHTPRFLGLHLFEHCAPLRSVRSFCTNQVGGSYQDIILLKRSRAQQD
jgi:hypothetical protein